MHRNLESIDFFQIRLLILDLDGVLTDGSIFLHADGSESKRFHVQDGHGIKMWQRAGLEVAIISGREAKVTDLRAEQLGIQHVLQGRKKKLPTFESLLSELCLRQEQVAYIGDDLLDIPLIRRAGFGVAVANAVNEVKDAADYVTQLNGGRGAVREVIEYILKRSDRWQELMDPYLV
ncbi:MAG: HAD-IIIA family hydrolase [Sedimentisphaerales bacterium]|nr:HAD-IIIA family hydrolase [Sedimentisphaerales bacterium]